MDHDHDHVHVPETGTELPGGDHDMDHGMGSGMDHMMMMQMYFYASAECTILFKEWTTTTWQGMLGSCAVLLVMGILYEGLKVGRELLLKRAATVSTYNMPVTQNGSANILVENKNRKPSVNMMNLSHVGQSVLHMLQVFLSYLLMLAFMTYNAWVCLAIILGAGLGYFLFAWKRDCVIDVNEHCH